MMSRFSPAEQEEMIVENYRGQMSEDDMDSVINERIEEMRKKHPKMSYVELRKLAEDMERLSESVAGKRRRLFE